MGVVCVSCGIGSALLSVLDVGVRLVGFEARGAPRRGGVRGGRVRALGFAPVAGHAVRVDLVERLVTAGDTPEDERAQWLGLPRAAALRVIRALG